MNHYRVAITGVGWVKPGIKTEPSLLRVSENSIEGRIWFNQWRRMDRFCRMGLVAADEAIEDAGGIERIGQDAAILVGTAWGTINSVKSYTETIQQNGAGSASPNHFPLTVNSCMGGFLAIYKGITGANITFASGCTASADAIGYAWQLIRDGKVKAAIVGGVEEHSEARLHCFWKKGCVGPAGEGAAFMVLESMDKVCQCDVDIYGEIIGYGSRSGAMRKEKSLAQALKAADIRQKMIDTVDREQSGFNKEIGDVEGASAAFEIINMIKRVNSNGTTYITSVQDDGVKCSTLLVRKEA